MKVVQADGLKWIAGTLPDSHLPHSKHEAFWVQTALDFCHDGGIFVDVGAQGGLYSIRLASKAAEVHAFEPMPANYDLLRANMNLNHIRNIHTHPVALGREEGTVLMDFNGGSSKVDIDGTIPVDLRTLDSFHLSPSLMKIDVEGYEGNVLWGAQETLRFWRPVVMLELHDVLFKDDSIFEDCEAACEAAGYRMNHITDWKAGRYFLLEPR